MLHSHSQHQVPANVFTSFATSHFANARSLYRHDRPRSCLNSLPSLAHLWFHKDLRALREGGPGKVNGVRMGFLEATVHQLKVLCNAGAGRSP